MGLSGSVTSGADADAAPTRERRAGRILAAVRAEPLLLGLVGVAALLRFATIDAQSFWADEAYTAALVRESLPELFRHIAKTESTPPLYYVLAWGWAKVFGTGEAGLRSLSALIGTATVPVAYAAGRALVSRRAGLMTAAFVAVSPLLVWYSQEARAYALVTLLAAASIYFFARALDGAPGRPVLWLTVMSALALLTHYYAVLLFLVEAAILLVARPALRRPVLWAVAAVGAIGLALLPLVHAQHPGRRTGWIELLPFRGRLQEIAGQFAFGEAWIEIDHVWTASVIALVLLAAGIWLIPAARRGAGLALALASGSLALAFAAKVVGVDFMYYRPLLYAWIPAAIAVAAVLAAPRLGRAGIAAAVVVFAGLLACTIAIAARPTLQREDWRGVTGFIGPRDPQRAILVRSWSPASAFEYYRPTVRLPENGARVREIVEIGFGGLDLDVPPGWTLVERRHGAGYEFARFRAARPLLVRPDQISPITWWVRRD